MGKLAGRVLWTVAGTAASKLARNYTRRVMHRRDGRPRLPRKARRESGLGMALGWAMATGVIMALADVLSEQGKDAATRR